MRRGLLALALLALAARVATGGGEPVVPPPPPGRIADLAGVIDPGTAARLRQVLEEVERRTGAEIGILTVRSTQPEPLSDYSVRAFERWRVGKKGQDTGLLIVVAVEDRRLWITTGYGLEGSLPDGKVGEIRDREFVPAFRRGALAEGILRGTEALARVILAAPELARRGGRAPPRPAGGGLPIGWGVLAAALLALGAIAWAEQRERAARRVAGRRAPRRRSGGFFPIVFGGASSGAPSDYWAGGGGGFGGGGFGGFGGGDTGGGGAGGEW
jgi:uncharacterized protein